MKKSLFFMILVVSMFLTSCVNNLDISNKPAVLTLAVYGERGIPAVRIFNESQDEFYIEQVDYSQNGSLSSAEALTRLNAELNSGKGPDLFYLWNMDMDVEVYGQKGYLEDLYPYLDKDPQLSREDILPSLRAAYEVNEALYGTVSSFGIYTMFGSSEELSCYDEWDFDAMLDLAEKHGGVTELLSTVYSKNEFLQSALQATLSDFANLTTGEVFFDSDSFRNLLLFCNELESAPDYSEPPKNPGISFYVINSFKQLQFYEALYGDEISFVGYPSSTNGGHCFINLIDQFAMNSESQNKDGAWQFLRILLTEEYQTEYDNAQFPTNVKALENKILEAQTDVETAPVSPQLYDNEILNEDNFIFTSATDQQIDNVMLLINDTATIGNSQFELIELVVDEAEDYFQGAKSLDDVVNIIQHITTMYFAERQ